MEGLRTLDDLKIWEKSFSEFGIDIKGMLGEDQTDQQIDLIEVDSLLEEELEKDAQHQRYEWVIRDRAWEAFGLLESDGPGIGVEGRLNPYDYSPQKNKEKPFINLMKGNVERSIAQLEAANFGINARARNPEDRDKVRALNKLKDYILSKNEFSTQYENYIRDGVVFGSGYLSVDHGDWLDNPDLTMYAQKFANKEVLTQEEFIYLKKILKGHRIKHVPTFEIINYRGAKGLKGRSIHNPCHRWMHRVEQISISQAKNEFPEYANEFFPQTSEVYQQTNPEYYYRNDVDDTVTKKTSWIRFQISGIGNFPVEYPDQIMEESLAIRRYAVAEITRIEGFGVVDMDIDVYGHNRFPFTNWVYSDSYRHSRGIGICKYGRDPQIVHNMLHNGMLEWFSTSVKNGGYVDSRLGLTDEQLNRRTKPGEMIRVKVPERLEGKSLKDLIVNEKPPTFPSAYAQLMGIESSAIDDAMNIPNVSKGIRSGSSGLQEQVLQQQADMTFSTTETVLRQSLGPLGVLVYSNIQQFERDPISFTTTDETTQEQQVVEINMPKAWYLSSDAIDGVVPRYSYIENDIRSLMFNVEVSTQSVIPTKPIEKAAFMNQFFTNTANYIGDPIMREWLKGLNKHGYQIEGIDETILKIEEKEAQRNQQQQQMMEMQQQALQQQQQQELMLDKYDKDTDRKKVNQDFHTSQQKVMIEMMKVLNEIKTTQASQMANQVNPRLNTPINNGGRQQ